MAGIFRWGIIGLGSIANKFAEGLSVVEGAELVAVGSRSQEKAEAFGDKWGAGRRYDSYEALAADPEVDGIYIATPHSEHRVNALLSLAHGKATLVEKPFAINGAQAEEPIAFARSQGVFLMEAMWTRFLPAIARVRELVASGAIGEVQMVQADFGFRAGFNPEGRLFNPKLGGGALLDVGIYPLSLASMLLGTPVETTGLATLGETGVDELSAFLLRYAGGQIAVLSTAVRANTFQEAGIVGTEGRIRIHSPWWRPSAITISAGGKDEREELPFEGNGYNYEAIEVQQCVAAGKLESSVIPLDETLAMMKTMDSLRAQWGLKYPME